MNEHQEKKLNEIHELLAGSLEKKGLVHEFDYVKKQVSVLTTYKQSDEKLKSKVAGGVAVGIPVLTFVWKWVLDKFQ